MSYNTIYILFSFSYKSYQSMVKLPLIIPFANKKQTKNKKNRAPVWDFAKLSCSNYEDHKKDDDGKKNIIPLF